MDLSIILAIIVLASILVTCVLNLIFKRKRYMKYIPVIIMLPFMVYNFITMHSVPSDNFEALGRFVMGLFLLSASFSVFIFSITADIFHYIRNKNK